MRSGSAQDQSSRSYLSLQVLIFFNGWFDLLFVVVEYLVFLWKGLSLPYPPHTLGLECGLVALWAILEWARGFLGSMGNKTEQVVPTAWFLLLTLLGVLGNLYLVHYQIYVTRLEFVINIISFVFLGLEFILGILAIVGFARPR
mmetsp:Transcript_23105/g.54039  ORF Transcript_23105/g.54039 Transcript_23105/m.54039 type:complete len:144 (-) Transcript_23105:119-550(-)